VERRSANPARGAGAAPRAFSRRVGAALVSGALGPDAAPDRQGVARAVAAPADCPRVFEAGEGER